MSTKVFVVISVILFLIAVAALTLAALAYTKDSDSETVVSGSTLPTPGSADVLLQPTADLSSVEWVKRPVLEGTGRLPVALKRYTTAGGIGADEVDLSVPTGLFQNVGDQIRVEWGYYGHSDGDDIEFRFDQSSSTQVLVDWARTDPPEESAEADGFGYLTMDNADGSGDFRAVECKFEGGAIWSAGDSTEANRVAVFRNLSTTSVNAPYDMRQAFTLKWVPVAGTSWCEFINYTFIPANV